MSIKDFKARVQIIICNSLIIDDAEKSADIIEIIIIVQMENFDCDQIFGRKIFD